jgi:membrane-bound lytic murein transglycosylase D
VVAKGDTLWSISLRYEVQPELLAERNGLSLSSVIREGRSLRVPILKTTP